MDLIDRDRAWEVKRKALEIIFAASAPTTASRSSTALREKGGSERSNYALWCALVEERERVR